MKRIVRRALLLVHAFALVACADANAPVTPHPPTIIGTWRMQSFDAHSLPANYAEFFDEPVDDHIVRHVEIRLDSAVKQMRADNTYERRYFFTEIHDGVVMLRYLWGDHGKFSISGTAPMAIVLTSEYIENLTTAGHVSASGQLELTEELWVGEEPRHTIWMRQP
jgi:hypothetical protein